MIKNIHHEHPKLSKKKSSPSPALIFVNNKLLPNLHNQLTKPDDELNVAKKTFAKNPSSNQPNASISSKSSAKAEQVSLKLFVTDENSSEQSVSPNLTLTNPSVKLYNSLNESNKNECKLNTSYTKKNKIKSEAFERFQFFNTICSTKQNHHFSIFLNEENTSNKSENKIKQHKLVDFSIGENQTFETKITTTIKSLKPNYGNEESKARLNFDNKVDMDSNGSLVIKNIFNLQKNERNEANKKHDDTVRSNNIYFVDANNFNLLDDKNFENIIPKASFINNTNKDANKPTKSNQHHNNYNNLIQNKASQFKPITNLNEQNRVDNLKNKNNIELKVFNIYGLIRTIPSTYSKPFHPHNSFSKFLYKPLPPPLMQVTYSEDEIESYVYDEFQYDDDDSEQDDDAYPDSLDSSYDKLNQLYKKYRQYSSSDSSLSSTDSASSYITVINNMKETIQSKSISNTSTNSLSSLLKRNDPKNQLCKNKHNNDISTSKLMPSESIKNDLNKMFIKYNVVDNDYDYVKPNLRRKINISNKELKLINGNILLNDDETSTSIATSSTSSSDDYEDDGEFYRKKLGDTSFLMNSSRCNKTNARKLAGQVQKITRQNRVNLFDNNNLMQHLQRADENLVEKYHANLPALPETSLEIDNLKIKEINDENYLISNSNNSKKPRGLLQHHNSFVNLSVISEEEN